ncbi:MAG: imelysin family protein [Bacteroidetes bacterium]|nr:imelysin family protein [Bacteroidota bacterium]
MKRNRILISLLSIVVCTTIILISCSKSNNNSSTPPPAGNSDPVLTNLGANIIVPAYQQFATDATNLNNAATAFVNAPTANSLSDLRNAFKVAYKSWAAVSEFEFGPAADLFMTTHFTNAFPTDTVTINNNINGASYAIDGLGNYAAQGFPALDFMLFAYGDDASLARFTTNANSNGAKQYLTALTGSLKDKSGKVSSAWTSGQNYLDKFEKATGVNAGSSLSLLVNAFVLDFDVNLQNYKIGIPIGIYGPSTLPKSPAKVEGYYSGTSSELLIAQVQALQHLYTSGAPNALADKVAATNAQKNGGSLNDAIKSQWATLVSKMQALPESLSTGITMDDPTITDAFTEVRKMTVLLKVDMSSALGIKISFQDDDGD